MRLLYLIEQNDRVGVAAYLLCELTAVVEADIAGRRADHLRYRVLFHILAHVNSYHGVLVAEQCSGKSLAELCLTNTGRTEEDERAHRSARVSESYTRTAYSSRDCAYSVLLTDDTAMELILKMEQTLGFILAETLDGDTCPCVNYLRNVALSDGKMLDIVAVLPTVFCMLKLLGKALLLVTLFGCAFKVLARNRSFLFGSGSSELFLKLLDGGGR